MKLNFPHASEAFRKKNPHIFCQVSALVPEPALARALDGLPQKFQADKRSVVICCSFIALRRRLLDDDNNVGSLKPLRDAVANTMGFDDGDARVRFEYGQQLTTGEKGVLVKIDFCYEKN